MTGKGGAGFPKPARLTSSGEFRRVFQQAAKSTDRYFTVLAAKNDLGYARLGLAISTKSARTAVVRNRIKRLVRESFRQRRASLDSLDLVVIARAVRGAEPNALRASLEHHWKRLSERCASS